PQKKNYTIVGVIERPSWEPTWAPGYTIVSYVDESSLTDNERVNASVVLKRVSKSLYQESGRIAAENRIPAHSIHYNDELLRYYGVTDNKSLQTALYSLMAIIISVIMVGSVALIYNAFAISVSERTRQ